MILNKIGEVDPESPRPETIAEAADRIKSGGIVLFPTRCLYGLAADALNREAIDKVFKLKQRQAHKPILVLLSHLKDLDVLVKSVPLVGSRIMATFWPGKVTIVLEAIDGLPSNLTAGTGKIGVRLPEYPVASALVKAVNSPITGTSANLSGHSGCSKLSNLDPLIAKGLDFMLDAGPLKGGVGSTVIDVTTNVPTILREGAISAKDIQAVL